LHLDSHRVLVCKSTGGIAEKFRPETPRHVATLDLSLWRRQGRRKHLLERGLRPRQE
jgi:hypothetical protein